MTETLSEYLSKIPEHVRKEMENSGIKISDIIAYVYSDMAPDSTFADCWIFFDKSLLYIMTGFDVVKEKKGNKKLQCVYEKRSLERFDITKYKRLVPCVKSQTRSQGYKPFFI